MSLRNYRLKIKSRNPAAVKEVKQDLAFQIAVEFERERIHSGYTQEALAAAVGTQQSSIARLERGNRLPSLRFLKKIADKLGAYIELRLRHFAVEHDMPAHMYVHWSSPEQRSLFMRLSIVEPPAYSATTILDTSRSSDELEVSGYQLLSARSI